MGHFISPASSIHGTLAPPGDKSISHRALIFAAMARGPSDIQNCATGADVAATMKCLERLDAGEQTLDAANSGTTMRLLMGFLAATKREFEFVGDRSLSSRPMDRVAEPLRLMGASVELSRNRFPPVRMRGGDLRGINYASAVASAQVKGAVLLAGLQAKGATEFQEPAPSRDHTERLLAWLGADIVIQGGAITVRPGPRWEGFQIAVPGDFSSAAYLLVAACLANNGDLTISRVGLNPTRTGLLDVLRDMGASFEVSMESEDPEPVGSIRMRASSLKAVEVGGAIIPKLIDELSLVALAATFAEGRTFIRDAGELRVKETDRISELVSGLRNLGADIEESSDGFIVNGSSGLNGGEADSKGDHRLALTFAVAGLVSGKGVSIKGWDAAGFSYPEFERDLKTVAVQ